MRDVAFYELTAQVMPTLLIAILLEFRAIVPTAVGAYWAEKNVKRESSGLAKFTNFVGIASVITYLVVAIFFLLGELSALIVVFIGTAGWMPMVAAPLNLIAVSLLILAAIVVPFVAMVISVGIVNTRQDDKETVDHQSDHNETG